MQHIDEHTLELFVLNSAGVAQRRQEIEAHIAECHGCRDLVAQISKFYEDAGMELEKHPKDAPVSGNALVRSRNDLKPVFEPIDSPPIPYRPITVMQKFYYLARRHPIVVGSTSFACFAGLALFLNSYFTEKPRNPDHIVTAGIRGEVKIVDANNSLVWQWNTEIMDDIAMHSKIAIRDLDNDGINEVITTLRTSEPRPVDAIELKIFDANQKLLLHRNLSREVNYPGRNYSFIFTAGSLLVEDFSSTGKQEIIVSARNNPRSPTILARFDSKGNELGAFWHFGDIDKTTCIDLNDDGRIEVLAGGVNDLADTVQGEFPTLVVVDPMKIVSKKRATVASVFDLPISHAELYCLRFPISSLDSAVIGGSAVQDIQDGKDGKIYVNVGRGGTTSSQYNFAYVFDKNMNALEVKSNNGTARVHEDLRRERKLVDTLNNAYLENLRQGVRYWDGKEWRKEVVRVKH